MSSKRNTRKNNHFLSSHIPNPKELRIIIICLTITICLFFIGLLLISLNHQQLMMQDYKHFKIIVKQFGSISRILYFAVFAIYPVFLLLKWKRLKTIKWRNFQIKSFLQFLGKLVRKWHVPLALASTGVVFLHGYLAIIRGFKWDFTHITGILAIFLLIFLLFMGLRRFKRKDKKWHFKLAIGFLILFMIHASF
ncbi:hypothetical protein SC499_25690 [Peribacillus simplex]|uniref:hypothetical protein n=1 Tax=Peribacillus TaxID=2675229 RepID=UPI000B74351C|nr:MULTISPECIES: hypothetical protein [Peribacillus]MDV7766865.1 hypothetical protein [Peribacillus sp. CSMR9]MDW7617953.1 hypothetical protein [Peribacillus simplex]SNT56078.1 hypothetical protein SAMN05444672_15210 [Bacillus sp. OK838]